MQPLPPIVDKTNQRSEEVGEIINRMPTGFGFKIMAIAIILTLSLLVFGWVIKYPDVLRGPVTISTRQAPVKLISNTTGVLQLIETQSGTSVLDNEYIAVIKNAANVTDVQWIDSLLSKFNIHSVAYESHRRYFPEEVSLGELSNKYFGFLNALYQYLDYYHNRPYSKQKNLLQNFSFSQRQTLQETMKEYTRLRNKYELAVSLYSKDSTLFSEGLIPQTDFEKSRMALIASEQEFRIRNKDIISGEYQLSDVSSKLQLLSIERTNKERELGITLVNSYYELKENIKQWEKTYVFKSPFKGKVEFLNFLKTNDYIQEGQEMFSVLPEKNEMIGQLLLPSQGAGKVKAGQKVIIKLDDYPFTQYGSIKGEVSNISQLTNEQVMSNATNKINSYLVTINLPQGLTTNYGSAVSFRFEAKGIAEIVTDDRRLLERFFSNLKHKVAE